jgi:hypothetical protein
MMVMMMIKMNRTRLAENATLVAECTNAIKIFVLTPEGKKNVTTEADITILK